MGPPLASMQGAALPSGLLNNGMSTRWSQFVTFGLEMGTWTGWVSAVEDKPSKKLYSPGAHQPTPTRSLSFHFSPITVALPGVFLVADPYFLPSLLPR